MKTRVAAIEFGTSKIVTVIAQSSSKNRHCEIVSCGKVEYAGYEQGDWIEWENLPKAVCNSIIAAQGDANTRIQEIYIGVPCEFIHVKTTQVSVPIKSENGRVSEEDIVNAENLAAELNHFDRSEDLVIHRSPAYFAVDGGKRTMEPVGIKGSTLAANISFITVAADFVDDMRSIMGSAGITICGFLSPSLGEQLYVTEPEDRDATCMFVDCGMYDTEVSVLMGDAMVYHAVLPNGGNDITEALADELEIRYDEAEQLKRSVVITEDTNDLVSPQICRDKNGRRVQFGAELVCGIVREALDELCEKIKLTEADAGLLLYPRSKVYLTGGGIAMIRGGREYLERYLERKVLCMTVTPNKLGSPEYASVLGLIDLIFNSIEQRYDEQETLPMRVADTFKGLFSKNKNDD